MLLILAESKCVRHVIEHGNQQLQLSEIPLELADLNVRLISLRLPFMKTVALPSGKQTSIHGPAATVPLKSRPLIPINCIS